MKKLSDLRRARGLVQGAYSKIINRFGTQSEILNMLTEALVLMKAADVPGGIIEVEEAPASSSGTEATTIVAPEPEPNTGSGDDGPALAAEPPPNKTRRGMGRKGK